MRRKVVAVVVAGAKMRRYRSRIEVLVRLMVNLYKIWRAKKACETVR